MKYKYNGPVNSVTLASGEEILMHPGSDVELDENNMYTKTLLAKGFLKKVAAPIISTKATETVTKRKAE